MDILHGRDEELRDVIGVNEDFVTDGNGFDFRGRVELGDVGLNPLIGEGVVNGSRR